MLNPASARIPAGTGLMDGVPPIEQRYAPPRGRSAPVKRKAVPSRPWRALLIAVICGGPVGFLGVIYDDLVIAMATTIWNIGAVPHIVLGVVIAVAAVLWRVAGISPVDWPAVAREAVLKGIAGGVFGPIGGKLALGMGANEALQTASVGAGAVLGPDVVTKLADVTGVRK